MVGNQRTQIPEKTLIEEWDRYFQREKHRVFQVSAQEHGERILEVDYFDLSKQFPNLSDAFLHDARRTIGIGQQRLDHEHTDPGTRCVLGMHNVGEGYTKAVPNIHSEDYLRPIETKCVVRQIGEKQKRAHLKHVKCGRCDHQRSVIQPFTLSGKRTEEPKGCNCEKGKPVWQLVPGRSIIEDARIISISPTFGQDVERGQQSTIPVLLRRDLVDQVTAGDEVKISGWVDHEKEKNTNYYKPFIVATNIKETENRAVKKPDDEDLKTWKEASKKPEFMRQVIDAIHPTHQGHTAYKEALALTLFASRRGRGWRGDINILLCGDPGTGKSELMRDIHNVAPRSVMTNSKTSTDAGLTASAVKNEISGGWSIEAGALPLANKGLCFIDEIDKAEKSQVESLHEAMEQQTISVNKAGMNQTLPAEAGVITAGNPKFGRWDPHQPIHEQLDIIPTILSRFDAILLFRDKPDEERDSQIADAVLEQGKTNPDTGNVTPDLVAKMSWWTRKNIEVEIPDRVHERLKEAYLEERQNNNGESMGMSPRQLGSMRRFCEARARMHLRYEAAVEDAEWAINFVSQWLEDVAEGRSGVMDIDKLVAPEKASQRERVQLVREALDKAWGEIDKDSGLRGVPFARLMNELEEVGYEDEGSIRKVLKTMKQNGEIMEPREDTFRNV